MSPTQEDGNTIRLRVAEAHIAELRQQLANATAYLIKITQIEANGAIDAGNTWQRRRDIAWSALVQAQSYAESGLRWNPVKKQD